MNILARVIFESDLADGIVGLILLLILVLIVLKIIDRL